MQIKNLLQIRFAAGFGGFSDDAQRNQDGQQGYIDGNQCAHGSPLLLGGQVIDKVSAHEEGNVGGDGEQKADCSKIRLHKHVVNAVVGDCSGEERECAHHKNFALLF